MSEVRIKAEPRSEFGKATEDLIKRRGFKPEEIEFFSLHVDHDVLHSQMLEDAMIRLAVTDADCELIRKGTMA